MHTIDRFYRKVKKVGDCYLKKNENNTHMYYKGKDKSLSHMAYYYTHGIFLPKHTFPKRTCNNNACVNPEHMIEHTMTAYFEHITKENENGCIDWMGTTTQDGYGQFVRNSKHYLAHRAAWEAENDPIPSDMEILHSCDNRRCVNTKHMRVGTHKENMEDAVERGTMRGRKHYKLDYKKAREIRMRYAAGNITQQELADDYNVALLSIWNVIKFNTWKNV